MNNCVTIKTKEYEELLAKTEAKKSDELVITWLYFDRGLEERITNTLNLRGKLSTQVRNIIDNIETKLSDKYYSRGLRDAKKEIYEDLLKISCYKRAKYLKEWIKNNS